MNKEVEILKTVLKLGGKLFCTCGSELIVTNVTECEKNNRYLILYTTHLNHKDSKFDGHIMLYDTGEKCTVPPGSFGKFEGYRTMAKIEIIISEYEKNANVTFENIREKFETKGLNG